MLLVKNAQKNNIIFVQYFYGFCIDNVKLCVIISIENEFKEICTAVIIKKI